MPPKPEKKHGPDSKATGPATKAIDKMYPTRVALSDNVKAEVVQIFQEQLANASDMYSQAKFAHWNVKGDNFFQLHLLFDAVAETVEAQIDPIAERLTQLGGVANGTVRQAARFVAFERVRFQNGWRRHGPCQSAVRCAGPVCQADA